MSPSVRAWIAAWLLDARRFSWASRAAAAALVGLWVVQAHELGWTRRLVGSVAGSSAWSERDRYANLGWASLHHLSAVNIGRSVMVVPLLLVLLAALVWPRSLHRQGPAARCVLLAALASLGLYSFIVKDVPFNFYGSRYFLPLVVPLTMLAFGLVLAGWNKVLATVAALAVLGAAGYHTLGLVAEPAHQNGLAAQQAIARSARQGDVTLLVGSRALQRTLQAGVMARAGTPVVFIDAAKVPDGEALEQLVQRYMEALHAEQATLVSDRYLAFADLDERIQLHSSILPFGIRYATSARQPIDYRYYVASYRDRTSVLANARPEWIVGGALSLPLAGGAGGAHQVLVRTGGGWLWASARGGKQPRIEMRIDGVAAPLVGQQGSDFRFAIPTGVSGNKRLEILTSTFVPAEVGINADRRALGADLVSVRFENSPIR